MTESATRGDGIAAACREPIGTKLAISTYDGFQAVSYHFLRPGQSRAGAMLHAAYVDYARTRARLAIAK